MKTVAAELSYFVRRQAGHDLRGDVPRARLVRQPADRGGPGIRDAARRPDSRAGQAPRADLDLIVSRANGEENVDELYVAGADYVVSNASVGANILANVMDKKGSIFLTEGVGVFRRHLPPRLAGWTIAESGIEGLTGCTGVALLRPGIPEPLTAPPPDTVLVAGTDLVLIGSPEQEKRFNQAFQ